MNFLPNVYVTCEGCRGRRYNAETLAVRYKGHNINDVLNLPASDALRVLENIPQIQQKLSTLSKWGWATFSWVSPRRLLPVARRRKSSWHASSLNGRPGENLYIG